MAAKPKKPLKHLVLSQEEIEHDYNQLTNRLHCLCTLTRELVGGQPATREGIEAYVKYQAEVLGTDEQAKMAARILEEEIGDREIKPKDEEGNELEDKLVGQVNVLRVDKDDGPWLGDWMVNNLAIALQ